MVAITKQWLSEHGIRVGSPPKDPTPTLGILSFETAKLMSRLLSLHRSLSDAEIRSLRLHVFRSQGVSYLNSADDCFLLHLAYSERMEDLDRVADSVARLANRCQSLDLQQFDRLYTDLKSGTDDPIKFAFPAKKIDHDIAKLERLVSTTSDLLTGMETLAKMEVSERKLQKLKMNGVSVTEPEMFREKLEWERQQVRRARASSLWNRPFDKVVARMARVVCHVFVRICVVFGPYVSDVPQVVSDGNVVFITPPRFQHSPHDHYVSGPLERSVQKDAIIRNSGPISQKPPLGMHIFRNRKKIKEENGTGFCIGFGIGIQQGNYKSGRERKPVVENAAPTTVGAAALAAHYANVIILAQKLLTSPEMVDGDMREDMYQMLPPTLRASVNAKLKNFLRTGDDNLGLAGDESIADGWRDALAGILEWLAPMAHNMRRWQMERNYEQRQFNSKPTVLLLETLYFSDRAKTEAAIVELLVGLSCICLYRTR